MNMIDIQDKLKNLSEDQLIREMQAPSGQAPQFLVLSEITRRKKMRDGFKAQEAGQSVPTVAEEVVASAGVPTQGLGQMASAMAPKSSVAQNTGIGSLPVQRMASGGLVQKMADGGRIVVRNGQRFIQTDDGRLIPQTRSMSALENLQALPAEIAAIPGQLGSAARDFSAGFANQMNQDLTRTGDEAMRRQMAEDVYGMRAGPDTSYRYPEVPTVDTSAMDRVAAAFSRTGPVTGMPTPQQLAMAAAQPSLPPAPLPAFGPDFEYGGRGPQIDLDLAPAPEPYLPGPAAATELNTPAIRNALAGAGGAGLATGLRDAAGNPPPAVEDTGNPMLEFQENFDVGLGQGPSPGVAERIFGRAALERAGLMDEEPLPQRADRDQQGAEIEAAPAQEEDAGTLPPEVTPEVDVPIAGGAVSEALSSMGGQGAGGGSGGTGGGTVTPSGQGSYVSELEDALKRIERTKEQDKWLALAQAGMALMASDQPTLGGALGEAGQVGVEAFRSARDTYEESRMSILEAIAAQRAAAARAASGGGGGRSGSGGPTSIDAYLKSLEAMREGLMTKGTNEFGEEVDVAIPGAADYISEIDRRKLEAISLGLGGFRPTVDISQIQ